MTLILKTLKEKDTTCKPVWFMRQAGRYLPEFREIRKTNQNFVDLCINPNLVEKITLQPIQRFKIDAAIIFSDILMIPYALGQKVTFQKDQGPILSNFNEKKFFGTSEEEFINKLNPVYEAIKKTRKSLLPSKSLIGFAGAPWTLIYYMFNIKNKGSFFIKNHSDIILRVIEKLNVLINIHLRKQKEAGADIVQIFDSWAGLLKNEELNKYCILPNKKIISYCKRNNIPNICFPKGLKDKYKEFVEQVLPDGISIDHDIEPEWALDNLKETCIQGGMDPRILIEQEEKKVLHTVDKYLEVFHNCPYIFNLGHGILPRTNPELIKKITERVKERK